mmetsp:Transcript_7962/g.11361  ORF Transcript_7962/g.11361 Transcript_7962/m.11361 type:complete len:239 (-) Transcript_7962:335-1051(-)|eukprot:CAMPEP_0184866512 /NCGR_PEP_ID=MMETSP0580-20130426/22691_1 /TAXON_ID=1118495 /ORGANISM="Dactyliosolen fragilissimus" /LENGTH=238 /DNA_ID=CAMNT_0027366239 /DNA_START=56 /DNA_END=772 /DNA_ORIENTATION=+
MSGDSIETCKDGHVCFNGSKCVENPYDEGNYFCDCQESIWDAAYEGLRCEHKAEVYCTESGISKKAFCTNGGTCIAIVTPDEAHLGCDCPDEYEGTYCQFVKGSRPDKWPYNTSNNRPDGEMTDEDKALYGIQGDSKNNEKTGIAGEVIAVIVILSVILVITLAITYRKRVKVTRATEDLASKSPLELQEESFGIRSSQALSLEADGNSLKVALEESKNLDSDIEDAIKRNKNMSEIL